MLRWHTISTRCFEAKSGKYVRIRSFLFAYEQFLQLLWSVLFREEVSFKGFVIEMSEMASHRLERSEEKKHSGTAQ